MSTSPPRPWRERRWAFFLGTSPRTARYSWATAAACSLVFCWRAFSLGTRYSDVNDAGVFAPLLILFVPAFDTLFVSLLRLNQGRSPFLGSKDHFALRLEKMGFTRGWVVVMAAAAAAFMGLSAFLVTQLPLRSAVAVYGLVASMGGKVEIRSEVGKGTEVAIILPVRRR